MKTPASILALLAALLLAAPIHAQQRALPPSNNQADESAQKIKELQKQRIAVLKEQSEVLTYLIQHPFPDQAHDPYDDALQARLLLLQAELVATDNEAERIALYQGAIDTLKTYEQAKKYEEGPDDKLILAQITGAIVLKMKARRLEVEMLLEQAKAKEAKQETTARHIKELQKERLVTLKKLVYELAQRVKTTPADFEELIDSRRLLLQAELETAESASDRVAFYKQAADALKEYESWAEEQRTRARTTAVVPLTVKARRLEAEIDLEKVQRKDGEPEKVQRVQKLQTEGIATLEALVAAARELYRNPIANPVDRSSYEDILKAERLLLQARLDAAEKESDRIALYEKIVESLNSSEEVATSQFEGARVARDAILAVQAQRLAVEIELEQAKAKEANGEM
jgi:hypothetical protein